MPTTAVAEPQTWRCHSCNRILAKLVLAPGSVVEIKCKCNAMNTLQSSK